MGSDCFSSRSLHTFYSSFRTTRLKARVFSCDQFVNLTICDIVLVPADKYFLVPADKAANNVVVVCRLHYIHTLKQELNGTKAYEDTSIDEKSVVYSHSNEIPYKFAIDVKERQDRLPVMYWLPKLQDRIKLGSLQILALVQLQNFRNY